jgi:mannosyl-oligosaccharide alpha-1,2-mannosidase
MEPFPGLVGTDINIADGTFANNAGSWSGGDDSFYEYLIKMYIYDPTKYQIYGQRFQAAADSAMKYLRSEPKPGTVFLAAFSGRSTYNSSQHLTCFDGGSFILAGITFNRADYIKFGLELADGCHKTYTAMATGIGPDAFGWDASRVPAQYVDFFKKNGWYPSNSGYYLRPEVLESIYYAYRVTGDKKYQDWAWDAFVAINATCRTGSGFTEVSDVNAAGGGQKMDNQESFFFAEVLKYSYLIQAAVSLLYFEINDVLMINRTVSGKFKGRGRSRGGYLILKLIL